MLRDRREDWSAILNAMSGGFRFYSLSIVAGSLACNARCPFCTASMAPLSGIAVRPMDPDYAEIRTRASGSRTWAGTCWA